MNKKLLLPIFFVITMGIASAAPYLPVNDSQVIEKLPKVDKRLKNLRDVLAKNPKDKNLALILANKYIEIGRHDADPRYFSYVQSVLEPWWGLEDTDNEILQIRAYVNQFNHNFTFALKDLDQILKTNPGDSQALIMRAAIYRLQANYDQARNDCLSLNDRVSLVARTSCLASIDSISGKAQNSYDNLLKLASLSSSPTERVWALSLLADIAARLGKTREAESFYKEALSLETNNVFLNSAYADFLISNNNYGGAIKLLENKISNFENLLIRYALAKKLMGVGFETYAQDVQQKYQESRRLGDNFHQREEAMIALYLKEDYASALNFAKQNWQNQKEPLDLKILLEAAIKAQDFVTAKQMVKFVQDKGLEDVSLESLITEASLKEK